MALVTKLEQAPLEKNVAHKRVNCTYSVLTDESGEKCLQLDTYGSASRKLKGKKSQSLRFTPEALEALKRIINSL